MEYKYNKTIMGNSANFVSAFDVNHQARPALTFSTCTQTTRADFNFMKSSKFNVAATSNATAQQQQVPTPPNSDVEMDIVEEISSIDVQLPSCTIHKQNATKMEINMDEEVTAKKRVSSSSVEQQILTPPNFSIKMDLVAQMLCGHIHIGMDKKVIVNDSVCLSKIEDAQGLRNNNQDSKKVTTKRKGKTQNIVDVLFDFGPNLTAITAKDYEAIKWDSPTIATRKMLMAVFGRETLATHTLSGKPSPAFLDRNKPLKAKLDPLKIQDIIFLVRSMTGVSEKEVRNAITTKCADECKLLRAKAKRESLGKDK